MSRFNGKKRYRNHRVDVTNDIFAENAWYFRHSLVRANYNDYTKGIRETSEYLELFLRNLLLGENNIKKSLYTYSVEKTGHSESKTGH